jgi:hypothetical protein
VATGSGEGSVLPDLVHLFDDRDEWVRGHAVRAVRLLARRGVADARSLQPLRTLTSDLAEVELPGEDGASAVVTTVGKIAAGALNDVRRRLGFGAYLDGAATA